MTYHVLDDHSEDPVFEVRDRYGEVLFATSVFGHALGVFNPLSEADHILEVTQRVVARKGEDHG